MKWSAILMTLHEAARRTIVFSVFHFCHQGDLFKRFCRRFSLGFVSPLSIGVCDCIMSVSVLFTEFGLIFNYFRVFESVVLQACTQLINSTFQQ